MIKRYRKVPVVIEAVRFYDTDEGTQDVAEFGAPVLATIAEDGGKTYFVMTLEGDMVLREGDYIIKGVAGEFYSCQSDIFERTYVEVPNE